LRVVWHRRLGVLKKRIMLVLDAFRAQLTEKVKTLQEAQPLSCRFYILRSTTLPVHLSIHTATLISNRDVYYSVVLLLVLSLNTHHQGV
jgi:hypothetical protein